MLLKNFYRQLVILLALKFMLVKNDQFNENSSLDLSNQSMEKLSDDSFIGLKIAQLKLRYNKLKEVSQNTFRGVVRINVLYLSCNSLSEWDPKILEPLSATLEQLYFNDNSFTHFPTIGNLASIKSIYLSNNKIKTLQITNSSLYSLHIEKLSLSNNGIQEISAHFFRKFSQLNYLNLESNLIDKIDFGKKKYALPDSLKFLNLAHNLLIRVKRTYLCNLKSLIYLDFNHNQISSIEKDAFKDLKNLQILNIRFNRIKFIETGTFFHVSSIAKIYLRNQINSIAFIDDYAFEVNASQADGLIDLSNNHIAKLSKFSLSQHSDNTSVFRVILSNITLNTNPCILLRASNIEYEQKYPVSIETKQKCPESNYISYNCQALNFFYTRNIFIEFKCASNEEISYLGRHNCRYESPTVTFCNTN